MYEIDLDVTESIISTLELDLTLASRQIVNITTPDLEDVDYVLVTEDEELRIPLRKVSNTLSKYVPLVSQSVELTDAHVEAVSILSSGTLWTSATFSIECILPVASVTGVAVPGPRGPKGDPGNSGVFVGSESPTATANVWIDPTGTI